MKNFIVVSLIIVCSTLANSAFAVRDILLSAGPLAGSNVCDIQNHTDQTINVTLDFCTAPRDASAPLICQTRYSGPLEANKIYGIGSRAVEETALGFAAICNVTYTGRFGDITGTFCGSIGCVPLVEFK